MSARLIANSPILADRYLENSTRAGDCVVVKVQRRLSAQPNVLAINMEIIIDRR